MDFLPSLLSTTEDESCNGSSGLPTPESSPLFSPVHPKDCLRERLHQILVDARPSAQQGNVLSSHDLAMPGECDELRVESTTIRRICVIGAGYVGGPTAAVIALHNPSIKVDVLDRDERRIARWESAHLPIHEPGLHNIVRLARDGTSRELLRESNHTSDATCTEDTATSSRDPNLFFTSNTPDSISRADMIFIAVNTPTKTSGVGAGRATNMVAFDGAVKDVALHAKLGTIIVEKSTVPCGTAQRIRHTLNALRPGVPFEVLSNPEFLSEGTAIENLLRPDRVILGCADTVSGHAAADVLASLYAPWIPASRILKINSWSSELSKLVANAMLAQRISSINSISAICEATGANVEEVAKSVGLDTRIGPHFLKAGLGFGGSCFRKDIASLVYLAESLGLDEVAHYWSQVNSINVLQRSRFARKVLKRFNDNLAGKKIAMLGFAFKKNTSDARESPVDDVVRALRDEQPAEIAIFDPYCEEQDILRQVGLVGKPIGEAGGETGGVKVFADPYQACSGANAVLVMTDCDQFRNTASSRHDGQVAFQTASARELRERRYMPEVDSDMDHYSTHISVLAENEDAGGLARTLLEGYKMAPAPACAANCPDCESKARRPVCTEPVDWARIVYGMKEPKWVFDGRGILDVADLEKLGGVKVDTIGKRRPEDGDGHYWSG